MLTIKSELKMLTEKSSYVIHNDLRGYTSPVKNGLNIRDLYWRTF